MKKKIVTKQAFKRMVLKATDKYNVQTTAEARSLIVCLADQYRKQYAIKQENYQR